MAWRRALVLALLVAAVVSGGPGRPDVTAAGAGALQHYRAAHDALARGEFAAALARFESLPAPFVLADYAAFFAAETRLRAGQEAEGLERFRAFPDRFPDSILGPAAVLAAADTAFRVGQWPDAEREARRFLALAPTHPEAGRVRVRLAEARAAQGSVAEAIADLRRRWLDAPASPWGGVAGEIAEELAARHGVALPPLSDEEQVALAVRWLEAGELTRALGALEELSARAGDPELLHRALARLAPAFGRLRRGDEGIARLEAALAGPATPWRPALLNELGRLYRRSGRDPEGLAAFERLLAEHPDAAEAPEAWLALARAQLDLRVPAARATLETLIRAHPSTPAAATAGWALAWLDYRAGHFRDAAAGFRGLAGRAAPYRLAGLYWAARALEAAGEPGAAAPLYREILRRAPHGYYGILAAARLPAPLPTPVAAPIRLATDPIARLEPEPRFQKSRALWSVGFDAHALAELEALGAAGAPGDGDRAWSLAVAWAQIGETGRSLRSLRRAFGGAADAGTPGLTRELWHLLYPRGHDDLVRQAAQRRGLDAFFVAAVIREESSFDPHARSGAGAIGLMQLMPATARAVAADAGIPLADPAAAWPPPVNIALGTHYLGQLGARFGDLRLAAAGYNAGPHRVQRWRAELPTADLEEFVELIPFDETRGFVKRVYASWHHYRRLYGAPPAVPPRGEAEAAPRLGR